MPSSERPIRVEVVTQDELDQMLKRTYGENAGLARSLCDIVLNQPRVDWCPPTGLHTHSFSNYEYWVDDPRYPIKCSYCGYIDISRPRELIDKPDQM